MFHGVGGCEGREAGILARGERRQGRHQLTEGDNH